MSVLVDTSVWIDYFRSGIHSSSMDHLIDENLILTNDIILAELIPFLKVKNQVKIISLLEQINRIPLTINWGQIIQFQVKCLQSGINGIGIPDLLIAQNSIQHRCQVYSLNKHFRLLNQTIYVKLYK